MNQISSYCADICQCAFRDITISHTDGTAVRFHAARESDFNRLNIIWCRSGKEPLLDLYPRSREQAIDCTFTSCRVSRLPVYADNAKRIAFIGCAMGPPHRKGKDSEADRSKIVSGTCADEVTII